jgi:hypothetical protein
MERPSKVRWLYAYELTNINILEGLNLVVSPDLKLKNDTASGEPLASESDLRGFVAVEAISTILTCSFILKGLKVNKRQTSGGVRILVKGAEWRRWSIG